MKLINSLVFVFIVQTASCQTINTVTTEECGKSKGCFFKPTGCKPFENCAYFMSYKSSPSDNAITFELLAKSSFVDQDNFVAVGFSDDNTMGDDSVTYCKYRVYGPMISAVAYNPPKRKHTQLSDVSLSANDIHLVRSGFNDGTIWCVFTQNAVPNSGRLDMRDLQKEYYILLAAGKAPTNVTDINIHSTDRTSDLYPYVSSQKVSVWESKFSTVEAQSSCVSAQTYNALMKSHAILMIFGWWVFVAFAMLWARYFRSAFSGTKICGSPYWFWFHRTFNYMGVFIIAAGFICIFVAACGIWADDEHAYNHSILGMTASVCAFFQPLLSFIRCEPGHSKRFVFNWIHRIIGVGGYCCACAAVWFATRFDQTGVHNDDGYGWAPRGMLIFYYCAAVGVVLLLETFITFAERCKSRRDVDKTPTNQFTIEQANIDAGCMGVKLWNVLRLILLSFFILISIAVCVTLAIFIGTYKSPTR